MSVENGGMDLACLIGPCWFPLSIFLATERSEGDKKIAAMSCDLGLVLRSLLRWVKVIQRLGVQNYQVTILNG